MSTLWGVRVPIFHCLGRPCGHCQRLLGTAWCRVGGPTPTLPGHVGGCGTESRRRRTSRRLRCLSGFFLRFVGKDGLCYVLILLGCFFLWFEIYTQSCVWSWIAQINFIKNSIRFLQDFPFLLWGVTRYDAVAAFFWSRGMECHRTRRRRHIGVMWPTWQIATRLGLDGSDFQLNIQGWKRTLLIGVMAPPFIADRGSSCDFFLKVFGSIWDGNSVT